MNENTNLNALIIILQGDYSVVVQTKMI